MSSPIKVITAKSAADVGALELPTEGSKMAEYVLALGEEQFPVLTYGEVSSDAFVETLGSDLLVFGQCEGRMHVVDTSKRRSCELLVFWTQYVVRETAIILLEPEAVTLLKPEGYRQFDLEYPYEATLIERADGVVARYTFGGAEWPVPAQIECIPYW